MKINKKILIPSSVAIILFFTFIAISSCNPPDSEILGCVSGKYYSKVDRTFSPAISLGCMTKVEFDSYVNSPYQTYSNTGILIDRDLTFKKVKDCIECQ